MYTVYYFTLIIKIPCKRNKSNRKNKKIIKAFAVIAVYRETAESIVKVCQKGSPMPNAVLSERGKADKENRFLKTQKGKHLSAFPL